MSTVNKTSKVQTYRREKRFDTSGVNSDVTTKGLISLTHSRTGTTVKNWKRRIKMGEDVSSPLTATSESFTWQPGYYSNEFWIGSSRFHSDFVEGVFPGLSTNQTFAWISPSYVPSAISTVAINEAEARALKALYKKIREVHSQFAGGVFLAEIRKTAAMIRRPALALQNAMIAYCKRQKNLIRKYKGRSVKGPDPLRKVLADSYLEAVFGWGPFLSDIKDASLALGRLMAERRHERFRAFGVGESNDSSQVQIVSGYDLPRYNQKDNGKRVSTVVYYGSFLGCDPSKEVPATVDRVVELSGFQLKDFLPTVWELIPFSFLVDYFSNVGDLIEAATTDTSIVKRLTKVSINEWTQIVQWAPNFKASHEEMIIRFGASVNRLQQYGSTGKWVMTRRTTIRTPLTSVPFMVPRFEVPEVFSKHSLNIAALLAGARPGRL